MPIHDVSMRRKTRAARCPSGFSVFCLVLCLRFLGSGLVIWALEPGVFCVSDFIRLVGIVASRTIR
jgi:hypothetical protein